MPEPVAKKAKIEMTEEAHPHHAGAAEALRLQSGEHGKKYSSDIVRKRTEVEEQVIAKEEVAENIVDSLKEHKVDLFLPEILKDAVFVGHLVTDLDSVAGAIGAAELYGGVPALASKVNSETQFALDYWKVDLPRPVEDLIKESPEAGICLVDHQQTSQMNPAINADQVVGVIDHHALQSKTIVTDKPIYIDIRPWGSMSTIIAHTFLTHGRRPPVKVAGMLLCAILSDTLNLLGPTTTDWDRLMVAVLSDIAGVDDIQLLASQQFKAKSKELASLSPHALVNGDQKSFSFEVKDGFNGDIGFAVVETTDDDAILTRVNELLPELVACKKEKNLKMLFLAVVNIVKLKSKLILCGPCEKALALAAFQENTTISTDKILLDLGNRVSRKKDFIPALTKTIKNGWTIPENIERGMSAMDLSYFGHLEVDPEDPHGKAQRIGSKFEKTEPEPIGLDIGEEKKEEL